MSPQANGTTKSHRKTHKVHERPPFQCIALLLQGGGALGAYQAGVYEALSEANILPDWVAGISIGAINSALIAGNPPETRVERLRQFWETVTTAPLWDGTEELTLSASQPMERLMKQATEAAASLGAMSLALVSNKPLPAQSATSRSPWDRSWLTEVWENFGLKPWSIHPPDLADFALRGDVARGVANWMSANMTLVRGAPGFFGPRVPPPLLQPAGSIDATSYYDTAPLKATLERLVDFDRINAGEIRFAVGAVNVRSGNFVYFDNSTHTIGPSHVMASGALPPGFPPVEIEGEYYWDGGLVSNTPLQWVLEGNGPREDTLAFQVDLWSARGTFPRNIPEVLTREKEIQYSSRTRANSDRFKQTQKIRAALADFLSKLPDEQRRGVEFELLNSLADRKVYNLIQLIYRSKDYEGDSKDYEFSRLSMQDHWRAGYHDTVRTLRHPEVLERPHNRAGVFTFDLAQDGRE